MEGVREVDGLVGRLLAWKEEEEKEYWKDIMIENEHFFFPFLPPCHVC